MTGGVGGEIGVEDINVLTADIHKDETTKIAKYKNEDK